MIVRQSDSYLHTAFQTEAEGVWSGRSGGKWSEASPSPPLRSGQKLHEVFKILHHILRRKEHCK